MGFSRRWQWVAGRRRISMLKKTLLGALAVLVVCSAPTLAGKNDNGALLVHTDDAVIYTSSADYCVSTLPVDCAGLVTQTNKTFEEQEALIWFIAAFDATAVPAVTTIQFGIDTNLPLGQGYVTAWNHCGPNYSQELPDNGYPDAGRGNLVSYSPPRTEHLWPFYWFAVIGVDANSTFGTGVYPSTSEAKFVDDGAIGGGVAVEDLIDRFGVIRWGVAGSNTCPIAPARGACCTSWGSCVQDVDASTCEDLNGVYQGIYAGDNTTCAGIVCGACCYALVVDENARRCANTTEAACYDRFSIDGSNGQFTNASWSGAGHRCTLAADSAAFGWYCAPTPTQENSWGVIKSLFR
jgi:hypothetical protein